MARCKYLKKILAQQEDKKLHTICYCDNEQSDRYMKYSLDSCRCCGNCLQHEKGLLVDQDEKELKLFSVVRLFDESEMLERAYGNSSAIVLAENEVRADRLARRHVPGFMYANLRVIKLDMDREKVVNYQ